MTERTWIVDGKEITLAEFRAQVEAAKAVASAKFARDWGGLTPRQACETWTAADYVDDGPEHRAARLRKALGYFLADERFQVAVGGNPNAVEKMLAEARAIYEDCQP